MNIEKKMQLLADTTRWTLPQLKLYRKFNGDEFINNLFLAENDKAKLAMTELVYESF